MEYIKIRNWDKWQSYRKDRGQPPWIKLHRELLRHPEWASLTDAQRGQLVVIWLLAADRDGVIPASPKLIQKIGLMDKLPDIKLFIDQGFIEPDASVTPARRQLDHPETEAEAEVDTDKIKTKGRFAPPSLEEITDYCKQRENRVDPVEFLDHYTANGWFRGKTKIKDWKACIRTWEKHSGGCNGTGRENTQRDSRSRAQRVSDTLDDIARTADEREVDSGLV